jgi:cytochrome P450
LSSNRKLQKAFETVDDFLNELIHRRQEMNKQTNSDADNLLDLLLQTTQFVKQDLPSLTDKEIRDNLLAIIVNGHETVATSVSITLYLLARHPQKLARVQAEIDQVMEHGKGRLTESGLLELDYLDCVIKESLRLCPPMAGLQRVSVNEDVLEGWSIPSGQAVGITLMPLHRNSQYFGENAEQFLPERYFDKTTETYYVNPRLVEASYSKCPMQKWFAHVMDSREKKADVCSPLTFGDGARKCLGEHFAIYEMKVALTVLLHRFNFELSPNFDIDLELGKFGLFISLFPKGGVEMLISDRQHCLHPQTADCSYSYM